MDALCIIQDVKDDKVKEPASMAQTYTDAYITIVASTAIDAADGFLA